ncbi:MAG: hypothetical protein J6S20_01060 [Paludibacteraceae bacterium]|nr:hypothetical protein [Paludibacteraceae bacterium]
MRKIFLILLLVCSTCCYSQENDDPFGLYKKPTKSQLRRKNKENLKPFIGLNLGIGGNFGKGFSTLEGSLGLDMAGSVKEQFAMGAYFSYQTITAVSFGLLFVHGNYNESHALLWGVGYSTPELALRTKKHDVWIDKNVKISPNLRFGFMMKNGLYFMTDMEMSKNRFRCDINHDDCPYHYSTLRSNKNSFDVNFRIGYKFNLTKKKTKN